MADQEPVTINIVVNDPQCAQCMDRVSASVLYSCTQCGYVCRVLPLLAEHIRSCSSRKPTDLNSKIDELLSLLNRENEVHAPDISILAKEPVTESEENVPVDVGCVNAENNLAPTHLPKADNNEVKAGERPVESSSEKEDSNEQSDSRELHAANSDVGSDFSDDEITDPDYVSKNQSIPIIGTKAKGKRSSCQIQAGISEFLYQYEHFVAKSVNELFKRKSFICDTIDRCVIEGENSCRVIEPCAKFDFTKDVKAVLDIPLINDKSMTTRWSCNNCHDTDLLSEKDLEYHVKCHVGMEGGFQCCLCVRRSATRRHHVTKWPTMRTHVTGVHGIDLELPCRYCEMTFASVQKLESHLKRVHKMFCSRKSCKFVTFDNEEINIHKMCHYSQNAKMYRCPQCDFMPKKSNKYQEVRQHIEAQHPTLLKTKYKCPGCGDGFSGEEYYKAHYFTCSQVTHLYHRCMFCLPGSSIPIAALRDHMGTHKKSPTLQPRIRRAVEMLAKGKSMQEIYSTLCEITDSSLGQPDVVLDKDGDGQKSIFKCKFCYKKLKSQVSFERHMLKSHPEGNDKTVCQLCGKLFRTKNQYRNHYQMVHEGIKRKYVYRKRKAYHTEKDKTLHKCEHCDYTSPLQTRVRNHTMSVHMGMYPYKCSSCEYGTNEVSDLRRHEKRHAGIKNHACAHCDYKAAYYWLLVTHCKRQHDLEIPKKRKAFNFMGSDGSLRWKRRREKERDLQQRRLPKNSITQAFHDNPPSQIPGSAGETPKLALLSNGQQCLQVQTINKSDSSLTKSRPSVQQLIGQAMNAPTNTEPSNPGEIIYLSEDAIQNVTGQVETLYLVVE